MLGYRRDREAENLREFGLNLTSNSVCVLAWNVSSTRKFEHEIWRKENRKKSLLKWKYLLASAFLYPIKAVEEQPMYHNSASQCSLCEGKEGAMGIYISMCFVYYRNCSQHDADYLFGTNRPFSVGFRLMRPWASEVEQF